MFLLLIILSGNAYCAENYDSYLVLSNNGIALNGVSSSDQAEKIAPNSNLIKNYYFKNIIKYKNVVIDLNSNTQYTVKTNKEVFKYKSDADFGGRILDRLYSRNLVFDIQPIGDYLLFGENSLM